MKKMLIYLLAGLLVMGLLAGCGSDEEDEPEEAAGDTVTVRVEGFDSSVVPETRVEITEPFSLTEDGYAETEPETYTALHALITVLQDAGVEFEIQGGYMAYVDAGIDSSEHGEWAGWMVSYNGTMPPTAADGITLSDGDELIFYYSPFFDDMYHAYFTDYALEAEADEAVTLTLMAANIGDFAAEDYGEYGPYAGAAILLDGEDTGLVTDENGQVTLTPDGAGTYTVTARVEGTDGVNLLTYAACTVTVG